MIQLAATILILLIVAVYTGFRIVRLFRPGTAKKSPSGCTSCSSDCSSCSLMADLSPGKP